MNLHQSFGNSHPHTPSTTPSCSAGPSPARSPCHDSSLLNVANDYSHFNATPARLVDFTPQFHTPASIVHTPASTPITLDTVTPQAVRIASEIASRATHAHTGGPILPPVYSTKCLSSSPIPDDGFFHDTRASRQSSQQTPRQAFGPVMHRSNGLEHGHGHGLSLLATPGHSEMLDLSMGVYPMSAPATAPSFASAWDAQSLNTNYPNVPAFFPQFDGSNSIDWSKNHIFDTTNLPQSMPPKRQKLNNFDNFAFSGSLLDDPFTASSGAVNPGLLFTTPDSLQHPEQPSQIYHSQQRRFIGDCDDGLRRVQSTLELGQACATRLPGETVSTRPGLQRSQSDSKARRQHLQKSVPLCIPTMPRPKKAARSSPTKQLSRTNLASIPESNVQAGDQADGQASGPANAPHVTFTIDADGRARTHTSFDQGSRTRRGGPVAADPSHNSSDDDAIVLPLTSGLTSAQTSNFSSPLNPSADVDAKGSSSLSRSASLNSLQERLGEADVGDGNAMTALRRAREQRRVGEQRRALAKGNRFLNPAQLELQSPTRLQTYPQMQTAAHTHTQIATHSPNETFCVCASRDGEGVMVQCDVCNKWLHAVCLGLDAATVPHVYMCPYCVDAPLRGSCVRDVGQFSGPFAGQFSAEQLAMAGGAESSPLARILGRS